MKDEGRHMSAVSSIFPPPSFPFFPTFILHPSSFPPMNWARNNRFLAGFLVVMLLGVGGLGFLLYTALGRYSSVDEQYKTQVTELKRLQALQPYPDQANQAKYEDLRKNYSVAVHDLQADLASYEPAPETPPPTPLEFQDRLRKAVEDTTAAAQHAGVEISTKDKFYLGFEQYSSTPPDAAATPLLSYELNAINDLVGILLQNKRAETLTSIKRGPVPGETGSTAAAPAPAGPGKPAAATAAPLVVKYPLEIAFSATPNAFREVLDTITTSKRLFVVRAVQVKNQVPTGPLRAVPEAPGAVPVAAAGDPNNPNNTQPLPEKTAPALRYVVGQEKLDVILRIELAKVAPPAAVAPVR